MQNGTREAVEQSASCQFEFDFNVFFFLDSFNIFSGLSSQWILFLSQVNFTKVS